MATEPERDSIVASLVTLLGAGEACARSTVDLSSLGPLGSLVYDDANRLWIVGTVHGMALIGAEEPEDPIQVLAASQCPSCLLETCYEVEIADLEEEEDEEEEEEEDEEDSLDVPDFLEALECARYAIDNPTVLSGCSHSHLSSAPYLCKYSSSAQQLLLQAPNALKLLKSYNRDYPLNGLFQPVRFAHDMDQKVILEIPAERLRSLLDGLDWMALFSNLDDQELRAVICFFRSIRTSPSHGRWRRATIVMKVKALRIFYSALVSFLSTGSPYSMPQDACDLQNAITVSEVHKAFYFLEEQIRALVSQSLLGPSPRISTLDVIRSFSNWRSPSISSMELAEAGFKAAPLPEYPSRVRHIAAATDKEATYNGDEKQDSSLEKFLASACDRWLQPSSGRHQVPLAVSVSAQPSHCLPSIVTENAHCSLGSKQKQESSLRTDHQLFACPATGWIASCLDDGTLSLWSNFPTLTMLTSLNVREDTCFIEGDLEDEAEAEDEPGSPDTDASEYMEGSALNTSSSTTSKATRLFSLTSVPSAEAGEQETSFDASQAHIAGFVVTGCAQPLGVAHVFTLFSLGSPSAAQKPAASLDASQPSPSTGRCFVRTHALPLVESDGILDTTANLVQISSSQTLTCPLCPKVQQPSPVSQTNQPLPPKTLAPHQPPQVPGPSHAPPSSALATTSNPASSTGSSAGGSVSTSTSDLGASNAAQNSSAVGSASPPCYPSTRHLSAHLREAHAEASQFPDNYTFDDPCFLGDTEIPLTRVFGSLPLSSDSPSRLVSWAVFGEDASGLFSCVLLDLERFSAQDCAGACEARPIPYRTLRLRDLDTFRSNTLMLRQPSASAATVVMVDSASGMTAVVDLSQSTEATTLFQHGGQAFTKDVAFSPIPTQGACLVAAPGGSSTLCTWQNVRKDDVLQAAINLLSSPRDTLSHPSRWALYEPLSGLLSLLTAPAQVPVASVRCNRRCAVALNLTNKRIAQGTPARATVAIASLAQTFPGVDANSEVQTTTTTVVNGVEVQNYHKFPPVSYVMVKQGFSLRIRNSPALGATPISKLDLGEKATVIGSAAGDWLQLDLASIKLLSKGPRPTSAWAKQIAVDAVGNEHIMLLPAADAETYLQQTRARVALKGPQPPRLLDPRAFPVSSGDDVLSCTLQFSAPSVLCRAEFSVDFDEKDILKSTGSPCPLVLSYIDPRTNRRVESTLAVNIFAFPAKRISCRTVSYDVSVVLFPKLLFASSVQLHFGARRIEEARPPQPIAIRASFFGLPCNSLRLAGGMEGVLEMTLCKVSESGDPKDAPMNQAIASLLEVFSQPHVHPEIRRLVHRFLCTLFPDHPDVREAVLSNLRFRDVVFNSILEEVNESDCDGASFLEALIPFMDVRRKADLLQACLLAFSAAGERCCNISRLQLLSRLVHTLSSVNPGSTLSAICKILTHLTEELARTLSMIDPYVLLRSRFHTYGYPFDEALFSIALPNIVESHPAGKSLLAIQAGNSSQPAQPHGGQQQPQQLQLQQQQQQQQQQQPQPRHPPSFCDSLPLPLIACEATPASNPPRLLCPISGQDILSRKHGLELQRVPLQTLTLDLGSPCVLSDLFLSVAPSVSRPPQCTVHVFCGSSLETSTSTFLSCFEVSERHPHIRITDLRATARFLCIQVVQAVQSGSSSKETVSSAVSLPSPPTPPLVSSFETPPGNVGYVQTTVGHDGSFVVTPLPTPHKSSGVSGVGASLSLGGPSHTDPAFIPGLPFPLAADVWGGMPSAMTGLSTPVHQAKAADEINNPQRVSASSSSSQRSLLISVHGIAVSSSIAQILEYAEQLKAKRAELAQRQLVLGSVLESISALPREKDRLASSSLVEVAYNSCMETQSDITRLSLALSRMALLSGHPEMLLSIPLPKICLGRVEATIRELSSLITRIAMPHSALRLSLPLKSLVQLFNDLAAINPVDILGETFSAVTSITSYVAADWAHFIVTIMKHHFSCYAPNSPSRDQVIHHLKNLAKKQYLTQPSMYNPLLLDIMKTFAFKGSTSDFIDVAALEACLLLFINILPAIVEKRPDNLSQNDYITLSVVDENRCRTDFRIKRSSPLRKLFQTFCEMKELQIQDCVFLHNGVALDGNKTPATLGFIDKDQIAVKLQTKSVPASPVAHKSPFQYNKQSKVVQDGKGQPQQAQARPLALQSLPKFKFLGSQNMSKWTIYTEPSNLAKAVGEVSPKEEFDIIGCSNEWVQVKVNNITGWGLARLDGVDLIAKAMDSKPKTMWYRVTTAIDPSGHPVRTSARENASVMGVLQAGERVRSFSKKDNWLQIDFAGESNAWVLQEKDGVELLTVDQGHPSQCGVILVHVIPTGALLNIYPQVQPKLMSVSRLTTAGSVMLKYLKACGIDEIVPLSMTYSNERVLGFDTLAALGVDNADTLEVGPRLELSTEASDFVTVVLANEEGFSMLIKVLRSAGTSCIRDQYCDRENKHPTHVQFLFSSEVIHTFQTPNALGMTDMDVVEVRSVESTAKDIPRGFLEQTVRVESSAGASPRGPSPRESPFTPAEKTSGGNNNTNSNNSGSESSSSSSGNGPEGQSVRQSGDNSESSDQQQEEEEEEEEEGEEEEEVVHQSVPDQEEFVPIWLFEMMASSSICRPMRKDAILLICHVLKRISVNCTWRSLAWVLHHNSMRDFISLIAKSGDLETQRDVADMLDRLCNHVVTVSDASCCETDVVQILDPPPLSGYFKMICKLVSESLEEPCAPLELPYSRRLPFLLELMLPRSGVASSVEIDSHPHGLIQTKRQGMWTCQSCKESFGANSTQVHYRCSQSCNFDICGDCLPYPVPEMQVDALSAATVIHMFHLLGKAPLNGAMHADTRLRSLLFSLSQLVDPQVMVASGDLWDAIRAAVLSRDLPVGLQIRGLVNHFLANPFTRDRARLAIFEVFLQAFPSLGKDGSRLLTDLIGCLTDALQTCDMKWTSQDIHLLFRLATSLVARHGLVVHQSSEALRSWQGQLLATLGSVIEKACMSPDAKAWRSALFDGRGPLNVIGEAHVLLSFLLRSSSTFTSAQKSNQMPEGPANEAGPPPGMPFPTVPWSLPSQPKPAAASSNGAPSGGGKKGSDLSSSVNLPSIRPESVVLLLVLHTAKHIGASRDFLRILLQITQDESDEAINSLALELLLNLLGEDVLAEEFVRGEGMVILLRLFRRSTETSSPYSFSQFTVRPPSMSGQLGAGEVVGGRCSSLISPALRILQTLTVHPLACKALAEHPSLVETLRVLINAAKEHTEYVGSILVMLCLACPFLVEDILGQLIAPPYSPEKALILSKIASSQNDEIKARWVQTMLKVILQHKSSPLARMAMHLFAVAGMTSLPSSSVWTQDARALVKELVLWIVETFQRSEDPSVQQKVNFVRLLWSLSRSETLPSSATSSLSPLACGAFRFKSPADFLSRESYSAYMSTTLQPGMRVRSLVTMTIPGDEDQALPGAFLDKGAMGTFVSRRAGVLWDTLSSIGPRPVDFAAIELLLDPSSAFIPGAPVIVLPNAKGANTSMHLPWTAREELFVGKLAVVQTCDYEARTATLSLGGLIALFSFDALQTVLDPRSIDFGMLEIVAQSAAIEILLSCARAFPEEMASEVVPLLFPPINVHLEAMNAHTEAESASAPSSLHISWGESPSSALGRAWLLGILVAVSPPMAAFVMGSSFVPRALGALGEMVRGNRSEDAVAWIRFWADACVNPFFLGAFLKSCSAEDILLLVRGWDACSMAAKGLPFLVRLLVRCLSVDTPVRRHLAELMTPENVPSSILSELLQINDHPVVVSLHHNAFGAPVPPPEVPVEWLVLGPVDSGNKIGVTLIVPATLTLHELGLRLFGTKTHQDDSLHEAITASGKLLLDGQRFGLGDTIRLRVSPRNVTGGRVVGAQGAGSSQQGKAASSVGGLMSASPHPQSALAASFRGRQEYAGRLIGIFENEIWLEGFAPEGAYSPSWVFTLDSLRQGVYVLPASSDTRVSPLNPHIPLGALVNQNAASLADAIVTIDCGLDTASQAVRLVPRNLSGLPLTHLPSESSAFTAAAAAAAAAGAANPLSSSAPTSSSSLLPPAADDNYGDEHRHPLPQSTLARAFAARHMFSRLIERALVLVEITSGDEGALSALRKNSSGQREAAARKSLPTELCSICDLETSNLMRHAMRCHVGCGKVVSQLSGFTQKRYEEHVPLPPKDCGPESSALVFASPKATFVCGEVLPGVCLVFCSDCLAKATASRACADVAARAEKETKDALFLSHAVSRLSERMNVQPSFWTQWLALLAIYSRSTAFVEVFMNDHLCSRIFLVLAGLNSSGISTVAPLKSRQNEDNLLSLLDKIMLDLVSNSLDPSLYTSLISAGVLQCMLHRLSVISRVEPISENLGWPQEFLSFPMAFSDSEDAILKGAESTPEDPEGSRDRTRERFFSSTLRTLLCSVVPGEGENSFVFTTTPSSPGSNLNSAEKKASHGNVQHGGAEDEVSDAPGNGFADKINSSFSNISQALHKALETHQYAAGVPPSEAITTDGTVSKSMAVFDGPGTSKSALGDQFTDSENESEEESNGPEEYGCVYTSMSVPVATSSNFYYEVTITDCGREKLVAVGLHPTGIVQGLVGWESGSYAFHSHDGSLRSGDNATHEVVSDLACTTGDIIGCGWRSEHGIVYFTRNGKLIGGFSLEKGHRSFFPVVMGAGMAHVRINFGRHSDSFAFKSTSRVDRRLFEDSGIELKHVSRSQREGVGYAKSADHASWDAAAADAQKEEHYRRLTVLLDTLRVFVLNFYRVAQAGAGAGAGAAEAHSVLRHSLKHALENSALPRLLDTLLQNGSLTDMSRWTGVYTSALRLVLGFANHISLASVLAPHLSKIEQLFSQTNAFLRFAKGGAAVAAGSSGGRQPKSTTSSEDTSMELAVLISKVFTAVKKCVQDAENQRKLDADARAHEAEKAHQLAHGTQTSDAPEASGLSSTGSEERNVSVDTQYEMLLEKCRVRRGKILAKSKHSFSDFKSQIASHGAVVRVARELADARTSLPCTFTNAMYMLADSDMCTYLKVLITGVEGTPYSSGCFEFDIYCPPSYPEHSPKVNLVTTGNGSIRFNPNLYGNGKVCLSLLGTWNGEGGEKWTPSSTLLQVMTSIQSLIMTDDVYFNEPGHDIHYGTSEGERLNRGYSNIVRYGTLKYGILAQIKKPSPDFEKIIRRHFFLKRDAILAQCERWLKEAQEGLPTKYDGLVSLHNGPLAEQFASSPTSYYEHILKVVNEIRTELGRLVTHFTESPGEDLADVLEEDESEEESESESEDN